MSGKFIRVFKEIDLHAIKKQLLIYGDVSGQCANCDHIDIKLNEPLCPNCKTEFKYVSFRNIRSHWPKLAKLAAEKPSVTVIDFDDYKMNLGKMKAEDLFKD
ncbi:MAG TPA: hypothetical protein VI749_03960 [Candidatus Omnitrophota bacterium]|nr:hypothetical protein [Candidatus Omnitrophota bacterium]